MALPVMQFVDREEKVVCPEEEVVISFKVPKKMTFSISNFKASLIFLRAFWQIKAWRSCLGREYVFRELAIIHNSRNSEIQNMWATLTNISWGWQCLCSVSSAFSIRELLRMRYF